MRKREIQMALCLTSYKRVEDLQRQMACMLRQSYGSFHLFVAVKGVPEAVVTQVILPGFARDIASGRLTVHLFPNKNQLSNLIDTVRGLPIDDYDLFLKIDDDDLYGIDYLHKVAEFHQTLPPGCCSCYEGPCPVLEKRHGFPLMGERFFRVFGSSFVWTRPVMERIFACEQSPSLAAEILARNASPFDNGNIGFAEDNLIHLLMKENGCANIAPYLKQKGIDPHIIVQNSNASVTRGGLLDDRFAEANKTLSTDPALWEHCIAVSRNGFEADVVVITGTCGYLLREREQVAVRTFDGGQLSIARSDGSIERFTKQKDGTFVLDTK